MTWRPGDLLALTTERFDVRSIEREDMEVGVAEWLADPSIMVGLNLPRRRMSKAQAARWALAHDNERRFCLLVVDRADARAIGFYSVSFDPAHRIAETSVVIGDTASWGQNVVVETRSAILDFLFDTLGAHKAIGRPHGRNFASIYNYKALGFTCEAVLKEQMRAVDGEGRLDQMVFGMLKTDWTARKQAAP